MDLRRRRSSWEKLATLWTWPRSAHLETSATVRLLPKPVEVFRQISVEPLLPQTIMVSSQGWSSSILTTIHQCAHQLCTFLQLSMDHSLSISGCPVGSPTGQWYYKLCQHSCSQSVSLVCLVASWLPMTTSQLLCWQEVYVIRGLEKRQH